VGYLYDIKASALDVAIHGAFAKAIAADPSVTVAAQGQSFFSPTVGLTAVQNMLQANPSLNLIVGSDHGIEGGAQALAAAHKTGKVIFVGYGASAAALAMIPESRQEQGLLPRWAAVLPGRAPPAPPVAGGIDLSVGAIYALAGVTAAHLALSVPPAVAILARLAGVRVQLIKVVTFVVSGGAAALGGLIDTSRVLSAQASNGETALTFTVLAASWSAGRASSAGRAASGARWLACCSSP
jgi:hypothetical protein